MEEFKKTDKYTIFKKKSGRYALTDSKGKTINGPEKTKILIANKLVQIDVSKKPEAGEAKAEA